MVYGARLEGAIYYSVESVQVSILYRRKFMVGVQVAFFGLFLIGSNPI